MHYHFSYSPAWSIGSRTQNITSSNQPQQFPSPLTYSLRTARPRSACTFGTNRRKDPFQPKVDGPGPGHYSKSVLAQFNRGRTIGLPVNNGRSQVPGPGHYDNNTLRVKSTKPAFTMSTRTKSIQELNKKLLTNTSPGQYHTKAEVLNALGTIGKAPRMPGDGQPTPGVGKYNVHSQAQGSSSSRCVFGKDSRAKEGKAKYQQPGPGNYQAPSVFATHKSGIKISNRLQDLQLLQRSKVPGPNKYAYENVKTDPKKAAILGSAPRKTYFDQAGKQSDAPPPTHYSPTKSKRGSAVYISESKRRDLYEGEKTPGPGHYQHKKGLEDNSSPKPTIGHQRISKTRIQFRPNPEEPAVPGPGAHDARQFQMSRSKSLSYSVGKDRRFASESQGPGPGTYRQEWELTNSRRGFVFGTERSRKVFEGEGQNPGPGCYDVRGMVPNPAYYYKSQMSQGK